MSRKSVKNRKKTGIVTIVLALMLVVMSFNIIKLYEKNKEYAAREEELQKEYDKEEELQKELLAYEELTKTIDYIIEIAREKLGLVFENEIIYKPEEN